MTHICRVLDRIDLVQIFLVPRIDIVYILFLYQKEFVGARACLHTIRSLRENSVIFEGVRDARRRHVGRRASKRATQYS